MVRTLVRLLLSAAACSATSKPTLLMSFGVLLALLVGVFPRAALPGHAVYDRSVLVTFITQAIRNWTAWGWQPCRREPRLMIPTERTRQTVLLGREVPRASSTAGGGGGKSLITDEPWDRYDLESLLPLKETIRETTEFGFLLRHYWIPATVLTFRQSSRTTLPDGTVQQDELAIERKMARCRSNECTWREKIRQVAPGKGNGERSDVLISERLCSYDCYDQTYVSAKPVLFAPPTAGEKLEARRHALCRLPMLVPPGPVPLGFSWHAKVGDDYMNFRLEAEERIGETLVLVIRREGRYTIWLAEEATSSEDGEEPNPVVTERRGVTLFAWNRAAVLEDRFIDRVVEARGHSVSPVGRTSQVVTRLVRSSPGK